MRVADFHGYIITEDGNVHSKTGKTRKPTLNNGRYEMRFVTPQGRKTYPLSRAIYKAFNKEFDITDKNQCITFKDGDKLNVRLDNLVCKFRGDLIQGDKHLNVAAITDEQAEEIRRKYLRTIDNRPINQYDGQKEYNSYRTLAKEYGVTFSLIRQIVEGKTRNKDDYILKNEQGDV